MFNIVITVPGIASFPGSPLCTNFASLARGEPGNKAIPGTTGIIIIDVLFLINSLWVIFSNNCSWYL